MKKKLIYPMILITFAIVLFLGLSNSDILINIIKQISEIFMPFVIGFAFAAIINVLLRSLETLWCKIFRKAKGNRHEKAKRPVCLTVSMLIFMGAIFALLFMVIPEIISTGEMLVEQMPTYMENLGNWWNNLRVSLSKYNISLPEISISAETVINTITPILNEYKEILLNKTFTIAGSFFSGIVNVVIAFAFSIYVLAQKERIGERCKKILYAFMKDEKADKVLGFTNLTDQTFSNFIRGQFTEAIIIGLLCFIGMTIFQMPYAPIVSVLVGATALIPMVGAFVGTGVGAFLILLVNPLKALWFVIFIIVLQQLEGNLIYPKVVGKSVGLPGILVLVAVTIGGNAFGLIGMLISVPICAVLYCTLKQITESKLAKKAALREQMKETDAGEAKTDDVHTEDIQTENAKA